MKVFTLHAGTWDSYYLAGVFSSQEKAKAYVKKFKVTDSPEIKEVELDPLDSIVKSNKTPYQATCKKEDKIKLSNNDICEFFIENNVHFNHGNMYYYLAATNDEQAIMMAEKMRQRFIDQDWQKQFNAGIQKL